MKTRVALLLAAAAAAVGLATPANAIAVIPCEAGYVGVYVVDGNGELARACVRDPR